MVRVGVGVGAGVGVEQALDRCGRGEERRLAPLPAAAARRAAARRAWAEQGVRVRVRVRVRVGARVGARVRVGAWAEHEHGVRGEGEGTLSRELGDRHA